MLSVSRKTFEIHAIWSFVLPVKYFARTRLLNAEFGRFYTADADVS